jgi:hypothetical protein
MAGPQQRGNAVSFFVGELMILSYHGILFLGRNRMLRVSQLPTFPEDLLHLLCESAGPNPSIQGTPEKLRFSVPSLRSVAPDLER